MPGDVDRLVVDGEDALRRIMRLAVIIGGLFAQRFAAVAAVALQHQRPLRVEAQRVAEIGARCFQLKRRDVVVVHRIEPAHLPGIDPGAKRLCVDAGLADAAARKRLAEAMGIGAGDGGMAHPDLLVGPAFLRRRPPRSPGETASIARRRPPHARRRDWPSHTTTRCGIPDAARGRREMRMSCRARPPQIHPRFRQARQNPARAPCRLVLRGACRR